MSDLQKYIKKRKEQDREFANGYDEGYIEFKIIDEKAVFSDILKAKKDWES